MIAEGNAQRIIILMIHANDEGFEEITHTADLSLHVWAADLGGLLRAAARGLYALMGVRWAAEPRLQAELVLQAEDAESLLVQFLAELLYRCEMEGAVFDDLALIVEGCTLRAVLGGSPATAVGRMVKAVTYHALEVRPTPRGLEATLVLDV